MSSDGNGQYLKLQEKEEGEISSESIKSCSDQSVSA